MRIGKQLVRRGHGGDNFIVSAAHATKLFVSETLNFYCRTLRIEPAHRGKPTCYREPTESITATVE